MPNNFTALLPTLIAEKSIEFLRSRAAFIQRIYTETTQQNMLQGGSSVVIPKPAAALTPTDVSYNSAATAQNLTIPSVTLNFAYHKEIKVKANELESRISRGNYQRILSLSFDGFLEGMANLVDQSIAQLYSSATNSAVGTPGVALTSDTLLAAAAVLANKNVNIQAGNVNLVTTADDYYKGLLANSLFVSNYSIGGTESIRGGKIPSLYGVNVDYSPNVAKTLTSPVTNHNMMFEKYAFVAGFVEFERADKNAPGTSVVAEEIVTDSVSGISMRTQKYYDTSLRTWIYQIDCMWGTAVLDGDRFVEVKS